MLNKVFELDQSLQKIASQVSVSTTPNGDPIEKAVRDIEKLVGDEGVYDPSPPKERAYQAARKFLLNKVLDDEDLDFISAAIATPIKELDCKRVIDDPRFKKELLDVYHNEVAEKLFWSLSWNWLLKSYFQIDSASLDKTPDTKENFEHLQRFMKSSHHLFTSNNPLGWAKVLAENLNLLSDKPCEKYAKSVFAGNTTEVDDLKERLGIPPTSWFWNQLTNDIVLSVANEENDSVFKSQLIYLINYIEGHSHYQDKTIKIMLERYYQCSNRSRHKELCDFVIDPKKWGTPKLRGVRLVSSWKNVEEPVWRMVKNWVNAENLRIFIKELAARNGENADKGRFEFWVQYADQMDIKFAFGQKTLDQRRTNSTITKLLDEEAETAAKLDGNNSSDAIIMRIREYTVIEFSTHGTAAFIYRSDKLPFDFDAKKLSDRTWGDGLKSARERTERTKITYSLPCFKQYLNGDCIITHRTNKESGSYQWHNEVKEGLVHLGIYPDK